MIGIGIDTGGTYTDAVIYNLEKREIMAGAKSLTTREDLKKGIKKVIEKLPEEFIKETELLALSTTLATNTCVEDKGERAKLIFIGVSEKTFDEVGESYGIKNKEDVYFLDCTISSAKEKCTEPDWEKFKKAVPEIIKGCAGISIVQLFSKKLGGDYEKRAKKIICEYFSGPVVLGKDIFSDLNAIKRGAGALLNARLIPVIHDFLLAVKDVFKEKGLLIPPVIVRSDGTLMSEETAEERPVETLLCGPAASIVGARYLAEEKNALIVDMGGTTTDVAFMKDGEPVKVSDGIHMGNWETFVKGMFVDTFGLGGDTAVHYDRLGHLHLENYRIVPVSNFAQHYPEAVDKLEGLLQEEKTDIFYLNEFLILVKEPVWEDRYTAQERNFCQALKNGPLMLGEAADAVGKDLYNFHTERLEKEGILIRAGFTPTDAMILKGDYSGIDTRAAALSAKYLGASVRTDAVEIPQRVYDLVEKRLYCNLVRIFLQNTRKELKGKKLNSQLETLIEAAYRQASGKEKSPMNISFHTDFALIGVGAPTGVFLKSVAKMMGTRAVIPKYGEVANAIGAVVGNVAVALEGEIHPVYTTAGIDKYQVFVGENQAEFKEYEEAEQYLREHGKAAAEKEARRRGAKGDIKTEISIHHEKSRIESGELFLGNIWQITARGSIGI